MRLRIDRAACAGHARCAEAAGELFVLDDEGYIAFSRVDVPPGKEERALRGADACPERVIQVLTEDDFAS